MAEFIEPEIRDMRDSTSQEETTLLVGCAGDRDELVNTIEDVGGQVQELIGRTTLLVSISKSDVGQLCDIESVVSVERDAEDIETHSSANGNFAHPTDSMM